MQGLHHYHKRKRRSTSTATIRLVDKLVLLVGVIGPLMTVPQVYQIWHLRTAAGVSLLSWATYLLDDLIWLYYGILHKSKPIIVSYIFWLILEVLIVIGTVLYGKA